MAPSVIMSSSYCNDFLEFVSSRVDSGGGPTPAGGDDTCSAVTEQTRFKQHMPTIIRIRIKDQGKRSRIRNRIKNKESET